MKVSYAWIKDYVDCPWSAPELAERMTMSGLMVESLTRQGEGIAGVVVAEVASIEKHSSADHLFVARLHAGERRLTVVTGADNVKVGDRVPVAPPGSQLPDGRKMGAVTFHGVTSEGMMCSEVELGLGDDGSGIMILPPDTPVGESLREALLLDDWIFEFEIYPNRPDCYGVIGIAREVAALCQQPLRLPSDRFAVQDRDAAELVRVSIEDDSLCRRYIAHIADSVTLGPSPLWMQHRLRTAGMRPINNIVDITNFVMLEWGQPLHAFDFATLGGGKVVVRKARAGERIVTLDGNERALDTDMLVIADAERPVAIAGVMGGEETEVREGTQTILLEGAHFHPASVRRTSRRLGLQSEASHRFEKGLDPELPLQASRRALFLLSELAGARIYRGQVDVYPRPAEPVRVSFRPAAVNRLLGIELTGEDMAGLLGRLGFQAERVQADGEERWEVDVPAFRQDVQREADLVEEIVRMYGFDSVPSTLPRSAAVSGGQGKLLEAIDTARAVLIGYGLSEAITYSFVSPKRNDWLALPASHPWRRQIALRNPLSEEQSVMRTNLLGGLLDAAARNVARGVSDVHLFEVGAVFLPDPEQLDSQPEEPRRLGLLMAGSLPESVWGRSPRRVDFFALKGVVERLAEAFRLSVQFRAGDHPSFHPGRQAEVLLEGRLIGLIGEVHPRVLEAFDVLPGACAAELDLQPFTTTVGQRARFRPLPRYPLVRRDLALLVPNERTAAEVENVIREASGSLLDTLSLFDVYEGEQVREGFRSIAFTLGFRSQERTLVDAEVNAVMETVQQTLQERLQVQVRR